MDKIGTKVPMYYNGREIVLVACENNVDTCHGCVLESDNYCTRNIVPVKSHDVCCPKRTGKYYIFEYKEEE